MSVSGYDNNYVLRETDGASAVGNSNSSKRLLTKWYLEDNPSIFCGSLKWLAYVGSSTNDDLCLRAGNCELKNYSQYTLYYNASSHIPNHGTDTVYVFGINSGSSGTSGIASTYIDDYGPIIYFNKTNTETIVWGCVFEFSPQLTFYAFPHEGLTTNQVWSDGTFTWQGGSHTCTSSGYLGSGGTFSAWTQQDYILGTHCHYNCQYYPFAFSVYNSTNGVTTSGNTCSAQLLDLINNISLNTGQIPGDNAFRNRGNSNNAYYYRFTPYHEGQGATSMEWFLENSQIMEPHTGSAYTNIANNFNNGDSSNFIMFYDTVSSADWNMMTGAEGIHTNFQTTTGMSCRSAILIGGVYVKRNETDWIKSKGYNRSVMYKDSNFIDVSFYNSADSSYHWYPGTIVP